MIDFLYKAGIILLLNIQFQILAFSYFSSPVQAEERISNKVYLKKVIITGNTVFSDQDLKSYLEKKGSLANISELNALARSITDFYVENGYISSGAFLPQQDITDGVVKIEVVEGKIERIEIAETKFLRESYIRSRLNTLLDKPLNVNYLNEQLELLKQNSAIENLNAELVKGTTISSSVLVINVKENSPFQIKTEANNYRSPGIGEFQGAVETSYQNLAGRSDLLYGTYNFTEGFDAYSVGYQIPFFAYNGTIGFEYRNGDSKIIENFEEINIRAESDSLLFRYNQPIVYKPDNQVFLGVEFERQQSKTFILDDQPFSFVEGAQQGESVVSTLRLTTDWTKRSSTSALGISSELNFGLDIFDATVNENAPDGLFFSWSGQAQWTQALNQNKDLLLVTRLATQLSPDSLLPLEQFTLGGQGTVRGYRQNREVGDNALVGTIEISLPLTGNYRDNSRKIRVTPFFDFGKVWNNDNKDATYLASLGVGADWNFKDFLFLTLDWGIPLINTEDFGNSLQENGLTFSVRVEPF